MKQGRSLMQLAQEIERQLETKKDFIASKGKLEMVVEQTEQPAEVKPQVKMHLLGSGEPDRGITKIAHQHIASSAEIPQAYYNRMLEQQPELLARNVNTWFSANSNDRHMVRTLDGHVRALLSDRYKRIDHFDVMQVIMPEIMDIGGLNIASCEVTDTRMYLKVTSNRVEGEVKPGDVVRGGFIVSNSETGHGNVAVSPFVERLVCTNGMIVPDYSQKRRHIGRRMDTDDMTLYSDSTIELDMKAFFAKIRDTVKATLDQSRFNLIVDKYRQSAGIELKKPDEVVELTAKRFNLTDEERSGVLTNLLTGRDNSLFGLANAITRQAQEVDSYDRATTLEAIGWQVINIDPRDVAVL